MKPVELKITRIGNSHGVRLPAATLKRYCIGAAVVMEERSDGIFLRPTGPAVETLSWKDTANAMAADAEDWSEWEMLAADGLAEIPWDKDKARHVAEQKRSYPERATKKE